MRGHILFAVCLGAVTLVACSQKDSLYIDPGKESSATPEPAKAPQTPPPKPPESKTP